MSNFKPSVRINKRNFTAEWKLFPTYRELKRNLIKLIDESYDNEVSVSRSKRGEWGEWFENWAMSNGKPVIIKQGWM